MWNGGEVFKADSQHVLLHLGLILALLGELDGIVVVILGILLESRVISNDAIAAMTAKRRCDAVGTIALHS